MAIDHTRIRLASTAARHRHVCFTCGPEGPDDKCVCIYLDGMIAALHGDPARAAQDREIPSWLRNNGCQFIEITRVGLDDRGAMIRHLKKPARAPEDRDLARRLEEETSWRD